MYDKAYKSLAKYRDTLTNQEIRTLRGQIKAGQAEAAMKGLKALLERKRHEKNRLYRAAGQSHRGCEQSRGRIW